MLIKEKTGNIYNSPVTNKIVDKLPIEWYETGKRILHKKTNAGIEVVLQFLNESPDLKDGDILWQDKEKIIGIEIKPCECIVIQPKDIMEAAALCYEIGNRHLPLYYEDGELLVPYEAPLHNLLQASGYEIIVEPRKLKNAFKTTVLPHLQVSRSGSPGNKINQPLITT